MPPIYSFIFILCLSAPNTLFGIYINALWGIRYHLLFCYSVTFTMV